MILSEAVRVKREYDVARSAMRAAIARFDAAERAYRALPLSFQDESPEPESIPVD